MKRILYFLPLLFTLATYGQSTRKMKDLTTASTLAVGDTLIVNQGGVTKSVTAQKFVDLIVGTQSIPTPVQLTDGSTITWNFNNGNSPIAYVTIGGNRTLNVTNVPEGASGVIKVVQDGTGSRTLTLPGDTMSGFKMSAGAGKYDLLGFTKIGGVLAWTSSNVSGTGSTGTPGGEEPTVNTDPDATAAIARRETAAGVTLSTTYKNALHQLYISAKSGTNWFGAITQLWIAPGDNLAGSYVNMKANNKTLTAGSLVPTYNAITGWTFAGGDDATQHLLTGLVPSTEFGPNWSIGYGTLTNTSALTGDLQYAFGSYNGEGQAINLRPGGTQSRAHAYNSQLFDKPANGIGHWHVGYGGSYPAGGLAVYKDGTLLHNVGTGGSLPTMNLSIGGRNVDGSGVIQGAPMNMWYFFVKQDDELTPAQWAQMVSNMNAFKTAAGIN